LARRDEEEELQGVYKPLSDLFGRFLALGIPRGPELAEKRAANDQHRGSRRMRLERYFIGASILAVLAVTYGHSFFERNPVLATTLFGAYIFIVVYGGYLKKKSPE
jgi:hypothetical protein